MQIERQWPGPAPVSQTGLTLVEMLVSLVILGFVMLLVSQTVYQVSKLARAADSTTRGLAAGWGGGWTAMALFTNLQAPVESGDNPAMVASPSRISGYTTMPLDGELGIQPFTLELRAASDGAARTELVSLDPFETRSDATPAVVAVFPGRVEFSFVDRLGRTRQDWPPVTDIKGEAGDLPVAVSVRDPTNGRVMMWFSFQGETSKPSTAKGLFDVAPQ